MCKYKIVLNNITKNHEYEEMIKIFLRPDEFVIANEGSGDFQFTFNGDKNVTKKEIYLALSQLTGKRPLWGIVTGIRPVKMTGELIERLGSVEAAEKKLREYYLISEEKIDLVLSMYAYQMKTFGKSKDNLVGLYIGIPFCPTRCLYCSFASNQVGREEISRYVEALHEEVRFAGDLLRRRGLEVESVYIGGGTPTTLSAEQLDGLLCAINEEFGGKQRKEFTLEAGRPDTITKEKLMVAKKRGVDRISINPQSMNDDTLMRIGRDHDSQAIREAFSLAEGFIVNADVIAGLPGETLEDFRHTLREVAKLSPENITVHSLSVKRASRLVDVDKDFHYKQGDLVEEMLAYSKKFMAEEGYQ
ncbi:MAG: coproporphyrinogen dehydrogenase HemZ, partial [Anaerovoracaceae bacterium]